MKKTTGLSVRSGVRLDTAPGVNVLVVLLVVLALPVLVDV